MRSNHLRQSIAIIALAVIADTLHGQQPAPQPPLAAATAGRLKSARQAQLQSGNSTGSCSSLTTPADFSTAFGKFCTAVGDLINPQITGNARLFTMSVLKSRHPLVNGSQFLAFLSNVANARTDVHTGSTASGPGTTNSVVRAGITDALGAAIESGAITQTSNGSSVTLQGNAWSLGSFITKGDAFPVCMDGSGKCGPVADFLGRLSGSATLNLTSTTSQTVTGTVSGTAQSGVSPLQSSASRLSTLTIRYHAINSLDLRSDRYVKAWKGAFAADVVAKATAATSAGGTAFSFVTSPGAKTWYKQTLDELQKLLERNATDAEIDAEVARDWNTLAATMESDKLLTEDQLTQFLNTENVYLGVQAAALAKARDSVANGLTFEYSHSNPTNQPKISTGRVAYTVTLGTKSTNSTTSLSFNVASDFYENPPAHTGVVRDVQAALQVDTTLAGLPGKPTGTVAGYFQYQNQPSAIMIPAGNVTPNSGIILNGTAATLLAPKGNIGVIQGKLTFPLKNGTKLPVGITWSNRTELIKANEVRGHIGFDFDWSSLLLGSKANQAAKQ